MKKKLLKASRKFVRHQCEKQESGHDWWHIVRVTNLALTIAKTEACDPFIVEMGALFHDIADTKFNAHKDGDAAVVIREFLLSCNADEATISQVIHIANSVSFRKSIGTNIQLNPELAVVMDADRLDAIGAIGVARAFSFGGYKMRPFYDPDQSPILEITADTYEKRKSTTINHFYEKLLLLKDRMNTETARKMAEQRHHFMMMYLDQFYDEWKGLK